MDEAEAVGGAVAVAVGVAVGGAVCEAVCEAVAVAVAVAGSEAVAVIAPPNRGGGAQVAVIAAAEVSVCEV